MWGRLYGKVGEYMDAMKQPGYFLEKDGTYAFSDAVVNAKNIKISGIEGEGASTVVKFAQRTEMSGEASAALKRYGQATTMMKWGGRLCIAVAVASDVYDIYQSDNRTRAISVKIGGWAGGLALGGAATVAGAPSGPGALVTGLIGFGVGYFVGSETTKIVYDYFFSKGVSAK